MITDVASRLQILGHELNARSADHPTTQRLSRRYLHTRLMDHGWP